MCHPGDPPLLVGVMNPQPRIIASVAAPVFIKVTRLASFCPVSAPHDLIKILANILCQAINPLTSVWNFCLLYLDKSIYRDF